MTIKNHGSLDSGTGINLSKNIKILSNIENIKTMNGTLVEVEPPNIQTNNN